MPYKSYHQCNYPGCGILTKGRYCDPHEEEIQRAYEKTRIPAHKKGYNNNWNKLRLIKLARNPLCERDGKDGRIIPAKVVHHKDRNPRNNKINNLESLCVSCHEEEHKKERFKRR